MTRRIRVRGVRRKEIDEDKLALAFLMLAKSMHEQRSGAADDHEPANEVDVSDPASPEAA